MVRLCLSRYAPVRPEAWSFTRTPTAGRGRGGTPASLQPLAHGWDGDRARWRWTWRWARTWRTPSEEGRRWSIADRFFAPAEVAALRALPVERQRERFFELWTLKEAYIKARGMGLYLPLEQFAFELRPGEPPRISFDPRMEDRPASWQFFQLQPSERHKAALAVRRASGLPLTVRCLELAQL